ncbi:MAG: hypothetical protein ACI9XO_002732 [Paraglaciecola sp.]|jgi:hypothetical protein
MASSDFLRLNIERIGVWGILVDVWGFKIDE